MNEFFVLAFVVMPVVVVAQGHAAMRPNAWDVRRYRDTHTAE